MPSVGPMELIIVLVVVLLLFGSSRLPKLARSIGEASREFKAGLDQGKAGDDDDDVAAGDERVTMTRAELEAMLAEREAAARRASAPPASPPSPPAPRPLASDTPPSPPSS